MTWSVNLAWNIEWTDAAVESLRRLSAPVREDVIRYMRDRVAKEDNARLYGKALVGGLAGLWRYRVGDDRVICRITDKRLVVLVVDVGHRGDVYR